MWHAGQVGGSGTRARWDFFVSYTQADRAWAEWIAWQLEEDRYQVLIQAWDMVPGANWTHLMQKGIRGADRTIAVLSTAYLESVFGTAEWEAAWRDDPIGEQRKLLVFRVAESDRPGLRPPRTARARRTIRRSTLRAGQSQRPLLNRDSPSEIPHERQTIVVTVPEGELPRTPRGVA